MTDPSNSIEPKWGQLGTLTAIKNEVNKAIGLKPGFNNLSLWGQLDALANHFEANRMFTRDANNQLVDAPGSVRVDRYLYTGDNGWIDLHHFFYTAMLAEEYTPSLALNAVITAEYIQSQSSGQANSAYSYEDLPSNKAGVDFYIQYHQDLSNGKIDFNAAVHNFFTQRAAKNPWDAPNYMYIPHIIDQYTPRNETTKGLTGEVLRQKAKESFCKKSLAIQKAIKDAHFQQHPSSH